MKLSNKPRHFAARPKKSWGMKNRPGGRYSHRSFLSAVKRALSESRPAPKETRLWEKRRFAPMALYNKVMDNQPNSRFARTMRGMVARAVKGGGRAK